jgi:hypothetical protein
MVRDQLTNSSLELDRAHHANLEAEIAQRATQLVLDVERLGLQELATGQQYAALLVGQRLHMHRSVLSTRTPRSIASSSRWAASYLRPSSAAFITTIAESSFQYT